MGLSASNSLAASHNKFSSQLYQTITQKKQKENVVFSPVSIYLAMLMATSGANGESLTELVNGLGIDKAPSTIEEWRQIVEPFATTFYSNLNTSILNVANNAFVEQNATLDGKYKDHVKKAFQAQVTQCDFAGNAEGETKKINEWVSSKTNQMIKDLIEPGLLTSLTRLVLVNAIHFLGAWKKAFDKENSYNGTFYGAEGENTCRMMSKSDSKEQYGSEGGYHWVTLPFSDVKYKMTIVAVKDQSFQQTLDGWVAQKLNQGIDTAFPTNEAKLSSFRFPAFELEQGLELSEILQSAPFNIKKPFTNEADFSNLLTKEDIFIDKVIHKAAIKVDEAGAEASAATAIVMRTLSYDPNQISFIAESPFTFVLSDDSSKTVLFVGKVNKL
ncbi:predicted protein [Naegleria gruberi]|uniref:Predicted protein n=1 Tax=Naegleria gruberi TaxID=5762 RepID=D2VZX6_NAEGR|nr:uncharacterized protein NAEGRDRAFT_74653 [Naegleria gruberi]EFC37609.1 predicted protein [Naegleria gruberi]|eukprot:XP_002670353.1 predicted protein [Naegleria gruberi strain NEG-M]